MLRIAVSLGLCAALSGFGSAQTTNWIADDLHPIDAESSVILGVSPYNQIGYGFFPNPNNYVVNWLFTWDTADVFEPGFGRGTDGSRNVGQANVGGVPRAAYWNLAFGDPGPVNYLPLVKNQFSSRANCVYSNAIGGMARFPNGSDNAILWPNTTGRPVNLHPTGFANSYVYAISTQYQCGYVTTSVGNPHAAIWEGRANTFRDLHPAGYGQSSIRGLFGDYAVGYVRDASGNLRAARWSASLGGAPTIYHPVGATNSLFSAVSNDYAVGLVDNNAAVWDLFTGTHVILPTPPGFYTESEATSIWRNASTGQTFIGGYATYAGTGQQHAYLWTSF